jgi:hypothetical protein
VGLINYTLWFTIIGHNRTATLIVTDIFDSRSYLILMH